MDQNENANSLDLVWGIENIGKFIGRTIGQTHLMLQTGQLPAKQICGRWVASRQKLTEFFLNDAA